MEKKTKIEQFLFCYDSRFYDAKSFYKGQVSLFVCRDLFGETVGCYYFITMSVLWFCRYFLARRYACFKNIQNIKFGESLLMREKPYYENDSTEMCRFLV